MLKTTSVFDGIVQNHQKRYIVLQGSSSSSKTYSILQYLIVLAGSVEKKLLISVVAETLPALKRGALRDFINILGDTYDERLHNKSDGVYKLGNSTFEFFSADQTRKLKGPRRDILFINEANNVNYEAFTQLEIRTSKRVFIDFNPTQEFWVHTELLSKVPEKNLYFSISTYRDNPFAAQAVIDVIERRKYNDKGEITEWYKIYGLGQIGSLEGCIYENWEQINSFPDEDYDIRFGLDFGFTNDPTALLKVGIHNDQVWLDEYLYECGLTNQDIVKKGKLLGVEPYIIYADPAEPKSIVEIAKGGLRCRRGIKGQGSVMAGIDFLQSKRLYVTKSSLNLIKELRNYVWEKDSNGKALNVPIDKWNHLLDALRYAISNKLRSTTIRSRKVII